MLSILEGKEKLVAPAKMIDILRGLIGGTLGILLLLLLGKFSNNLFIMAPFGATCVILFAVSQSPLAQPRNVIFGHVVSAFIGLLFLKLFGTSMLSIAVSVGCAIALMQVLKCVHPPAGANPLVILLTAQDVDYNWDFLIFPVLLGSVALVCVAYFVNNIKSAHTWPVYGLAVLKTKSSSQNDLK